MKMGAIAIGMAVALAVLAQTAAAAVSKPQQQQSDATPGQAKPGQAEMEKRILGVGDTCWAVDGDGKFLSAEESKTKSKCPEGTQCLQRKFADHEDTTSFKLRCEIVNRKQFCGKSAVCIALALDCAESDQIEDPYGCCPICDPTKKQTDFCVHPDQGVVPIGWTGRDGGRDSNKCPTCAKPEGNRVSIELPKGKVDETWCHNCKCEAGGEYSCAKDKVSDTDCGACTLSDDTTVVPNGWSGNDAGDNWCNTCRCEMGELTCTKAGCNSKSGCTLADGSIVDVGWSGSGAGDNWCNTCRCDLQAGKAGATPVLTCTRMFCGGGGDPCVVDEKTTFQAERPIASKPAVLNTNGNWEESGHWDNRVEEGGRASPRPPSDPFFNNFDCIQGDDLVVKGALLIPSKVPDGKADANAYCRTQCAERNLVGSCTLSDGTTSVPNGWSGNDAGDNWCNSCSCEMGELGSCTEMACDPKNRVAFQSNPGNAVVSGPFPCTGFVTSFQHGTGGRLCSMFSGDIPITCAVDSSASDGGNVIGPVDTHVPSADAQNDAAEPFVQHACFFNQLGQRPGAVSEDEEKKGEEKTCPTFTKITDDSDLGENPISVDLTDGANPVSIELVKAAAASQEVCEVSDNQIHSETATGSTVITSDTRPGLPNPFCQSENGTSNPTNLTCALVAEIHGRWNTAMAGLPSADERIALVGAAVRLAFHDAGEFDRNFPKFAANFGTPSRPVSDSYGPDGCLTEAGDHAGLVGEFDEVNVIMEPIWQDFCHTVTRADFWVMAATFALWGADPTGQMQDLIPITYGRSDSCNCDNGEFLRDSDTGVLTTDGRMPVATEGLNTLQRVFVEQMGLTMEQAAALLGAHSLGGMSPENSGFGAELSQQPVQTPWVTDNAVFSNDYYVEMLGRPFDLAPGPPQPQLSFRWDPFRPGADDALNNAGNFGARLAGSPPAQQWHDERPGTISSSNPKVVFLNADIALAYKTGVEDPWPPGSLDHVYPNVSPIDWCGTGNGDSNCASGGVAATCCPEADWSGATTRAKVDEWANDRDTFFTEFAVAFNDMTSVGYGADHPDNTAAPFTHKLGSTLTSLTCPNMTMPPPPPPPPPSTGGNSCGGPCNQYGGCDSDEHFCDVAPGTCSSSTRPVRPIRPHSGFTSDVVHAAQAQAATLSDRRVPAKDDDPNNPTCASNPCASHEICMPAVPTRICITATCNQFDCVVPIELTDCHQAEDEKKCNSMESIVCDVGPSPDPDRPCGGMMAPGFQNPPCFEGEFCQTRHCLIMDLPGVCTPIPEVCPMHIQPVCGCDGVTYNNDCERLEAQKGLAHEGECGTENEFIFHVPEHGIAQKHGKCMWDRATDTCGCRTPPSTSGGFCVLQQDECCDIRDPVCGCDGETYSSDCERIKAGVHKDFHGECPPTYPPPGGERPCGGFMAHGFQNPPCHKNEFCQTEHCLIADLPGVCTPMPEFCTKEFRPVCGCDGETYSNDCHRLQAGVGLDHEGQCPVQVPHCLKDCLKATDAIDCSDVNTLRMSEEGKEELCNGGARCGHTPNKCEWDGGSCGCSTDSPVADYESGLSLHCDRCCVEKCLREAEEPHWTDSQVLLQEQRSKRTKQLDVLCAPSTNPGIPQLELVSTANFFHAGDATGVDEIRRRIASLEAALDEQAKGGSTATCQNHPVRKNRGMRSRAQEP